MRKVCGRWQYPFFYPECVACVFVQAWMNDVATRSPPARTERHVQPGVCEDWIVNGVHVENTNGWKLYKDGKHSDYYIAFGTHQKSGEVIRDRRFFY